MRRIAVALAITAALACQTSSPQPTVTIPAPAPASRHTNENLNSLLWMQTGAEYRASALQAYRAARRQLDVALADRRWTAALEQSSDPSSLPPAVVLDLDETVIDNSAFAARQLIDQTGYTPERWNAWARERKSRAVPGAVAFLQYARSRGVTPFYITNREHEIEDATRDNLAALQIPIDPSRDTVLTRNENGWTDSDKGARRRAVAANFRILLLVGDNFEDFAAGTLTTIENRFALVDRYADYWGEKWIILPNPTYGSWDSAITAGQGRLTDAQVLAEKYKALRPDR